VKAVVIHEHGGPEVLRYEEIAELPLEEGDIRVEVGACALNALDVFSRVGMPGVKLRLPHVLGGDIAGRVVDATTPDGEALLGQFVLLDPKCLNYRGWKRGVFGEHHWGGLAEYATAPANNAIPIPWANGSDLALFAALPIAYGTAHRMLYSRGGLQPGDTVAVLGAAGGVGVACIALANRIGARVIACSTSDDKLEALRALGAWETINTASDDFARRVFELTDRQGADVVVDYIGKDTWNSSIRAVRRGGRVLTCGASSGFDATSDMRYVWTKEVDLRGSNSWQRSDLVALIELVRDGSLVPVIQQNLPLSRYADAFAILDDREVLGKVILTPDRMMA
jgi:NADPH:quinone reductase-like Zn-dependent oxidoreductase